MLKHKAFTLIELMVVVSIIGVLAAILVPGVAKLVDKARVSKTSADLIIIRDAENTYMADVGSYPPCVWEFGRAWGADVGLLDRGNVTGNHVAAWNGPYVRDWPQRTAWGGAAASGCGTPQGADYVHGPIGWFDRDGIGGNDNWLHMNPNCVWYPASMVAALDAVMDDGNLATGTFRDGGSGVYVYYYVGEGTRSW